VTTLVTVEQIRDAAIRIAGLAVRTPMLGSPWPGLSVKPEVFQPIGAFKIRGATNAVALLDPERRRRGVVAHSSGNHAQAVAYAARAFGVPAHIVMPEGASRTKAEATERLGATVEFVPVAERVTRAEHVASERGMTMIPPFDHPDVIAGQGTVGLEIAEDFSGLGDRVSAVLVPVSGGGLISGIAAALTALAPEVAVIGVEPEWAGDAAASKHAGRREVWNAERTARTVADGLRVPAVGELPWRHIQAQVDDIITVTEDEILEAIRRCALEAKIVAEPSGAVPVAAHLFHGAELPAGGRVAVISGGNIDPELLARLLAAQQSPPEGGRTLDRGPHTTGADAGERQTPLRRGARTRHFADASHAGRKEPWRGT
jgi:threonine dehydratase